jgi:hypothetical protein
MQAIRDPLTAMKELGRPLTATRPQPEQKTTKKELIVISLHDFSYMN